MKTIVFTNIRGGCAKTTDVVHCAVSAAQAGRRVLVVDLDPQAHTTWSLNKDFKDRADDSDVAPLFIDKVIEHRKAKPQDVTSSLLGTVKIIPGRRAFGATFNGPTFTRVRWETALEDALRPLENDFDYCLIDTPATYLNVHALAFKASDFYLLSLRPEAFSYVGFLESEEEIEKVKEQLDTKNPRFLAYIVNGVHAGNRIGVREMREGIKDRGRSRMIEISESTKFDTARWNGGDTASIFDLPRTVPLRKEFQAAWKNLETWMPLAEKEG